MKISGADIEAKRPPFLGRWLRAGAAGVGTALGRFPAAVLTIAAIAMVTNLEIAESRFLGAVDVERLVAALLVASALSVSLTLVLESIDRRPSISRLGGFGIAVAAGLLVWFVRPPNLVAEPLLAASLLAIPLAPGIVGSTSLRFWTFTLRTILGCCFGFASVLLFVLGVSAIVEMVRFLFGFGIDAAIYKHVYATAITFVGPVFALGRIPATFGDEADEGRSDWLLSGIKVLADWIGAPLTLAMGALLHAYVVKIALAGDMPANRLGWIVSSYILVVLTQRFLIEPFPRTAGWASRLFRRFWAIGLVVPTALLGYALTLRVGTDGWTAERYSLGLIISFSALLLLARFLASLRGDVRSFVGIPAVLLALASFGPWGLSQTVGRSQSALIREEFVDAAGMIRRDGLSEPDKDRLRSRIDALSSVGALSELSPLLPAGTPISDTRDRRSAVLQALGLDYGRTSVPERVFVAGRQAAFDVSGFDTVYGGLVANASENDGAASARLSGAATLQLTIGSVVDDIDLTELAARIPITVPDRRAAEPIVVDISTGEGRLVRLRVSSATLDDGRVTQIGFDAALKRDQWSR